MSDLRQRYFRILKERKLPESGVSRYADALLAALDERLEMDRKQVESNWNSHVRLADKIKAIEREEA